MRLMKNRELGAIEARNYLLAESPYRTDAVFQYVNALYPRKRKRMLKRVKQYQYLPDDSTDLYLGDVISTCYPGRPKILKRCRRTSLFVRIKGHLPMWLEKLRTKAN